MFKYKTYLKICKRVKTEEDRQKRTDTRGQTEEDRQKMNKVYEEIWKHELPLDEVMLKYFETTNDIMEAEHKMYFAALFVSR